METICIYIYIYPKSLTSAGSSSCYAQVVGSVSNLPLLTIGDYYNYSYDKMMKGKIETGQGYGMGIGGCNRLCPAANGSQFGYTVFPVRVDYGPYIAVDGSQVTDLLS